MYWPGLVVGLGSRQCIDFLHTSSITGHGIGKDLQKAMERSRDKRPGAIRARLLYLQSAAACR